MIPPTFLLATTPDRHHPHQNDNDEQQVEKRGLLGWILPASIALHVAVVVLLPQSRSIERIVPPSIVVEVQEPAPPPPPPPPPPLLPQKPKPAPVETIETKPSASQPNEPTPVATNNTNNAPLDFSAMTFSNDGPGLAIGTPAPAPPAPIIATTKPSAAPTVTATAGSPPPFVPLASLKRAPRAPAGLDSELERNYPMEARRSGISGQAILRVQLEPDGRVGRVDVVSESYTGFGNACARTVRSARWEPPLDRDGHPVSTEIKYVCRFEVGS